MGWIDEKLEITNQVVQSSLIYAYQYGIPLMLISFGGWWLIQPLRELGNKPTGLSQSDIKNANVTREPTFISIAEAATRIYESKITMNGITISRYADGLGKTHGGASPNERLDWIATFLGDKIQISGKKPPARTVDQIAMEVVKRSSFTGGATILRDNSYPESIYWTDLCVMESDVIELIADLEGAAIDAELANDMERETFRQKPTKEAARLRLTRLRDLGVSIRNDAAWLLYTTDLDKWTRRVINWQKDVRDAIKIIDEPDSIWFGTLDAVPPPRVKIPPVRLGGDGDRQMFVSTFSQHDFRLARLAQLLVKYGVGA